MNLLFLCSDTVCYSVLILSNNYRNSISRAIYLINNYEANAVAFTYGVATWSIKILTLKMYLPHYIPYIWKCGVWVRKPSAICCCCLLLLCRYCMLSAYTVVSTLPPVSWGTKSQLCTFFVCIQWTHGESVWF